MQFLISIIYIEVIAVALKLRIQFFSTVKYIIIIFKSNHFYIFHVRS